MKIPSATPKQVLDAMRQKRTVDPERLGNFMDMSPADRDELLFRLVTILAAAVDEDYRK
jgi:hypothetical protein